jgi:hypothetical protein
MKSKLEELAKLLEDDTNFSRFQFKIKDEETLKYLDFGKDEDHLAGEFQMVQLEYLRRVLNDIDNNDVLALGQADERGKAIYFLKREEWQNDFDFIQKIVNSVRMEDLLKYGGGDFTGIDYFISRVDLKNNHDFIAFKAISPVQTIYTDKAMQRKDKGYAKPKSNLFRIPQNFDFFVYDGCLFITNINMFEKKNSTRLANFRERETEKTLKIIEEENMLSKEVCNKLRDFLKKDERLSRKIVRARGRLQTSSKKINEIAVISYIRENFPGYKLIVGGKIILETKKNAKDFVSVFCDEYLRSGLTGHAYNIKASNLLAEGKGGV